MNAVAPVNGANMRRITVAQGDSVATRDLDVVYTTVLGSCVAVCLFDKRARVGGINHFLLADAAPTGLEQTAFLNRYGIHSMELLINAMIKTGAMRSNFKARIYGGATMREGLGAIGERNIEFARKFLANEGIPLLGEDVGGSSARRVEFMPGYGLSRCKTVHIKPVEAAPPRILPTGGDVELF